LLLIIRKLRHTDVANVHYERAVGPIPCLASMCDVLKGSKLPSAAALSRVVTRRFAGKSRDRNGLAGDHEC